MKILCFGSANLDHIYQVDHFTEPGETQSCITYSVNCGGKGCNQAIAMALAGNDTYFAGKIGSDGMILKDTLLAKGVHVDAVECTDGHTGHAVIEIDRNGQNRIVIYGGTNQMITREYVDQVLSEFSSGDIVVLQNEISNIPYIMERAFEKGMVIVFNVAPCDRTVSAFPIEKADWLIVNETEGAVLSGETELEKIPERLKQKYPDTNIVFTMGESGSRVITGNEDIRVDAFDVQAVDTTGAGDTYIGYFVKGIAEGWTLEKTVHLATAASAIAVARPGAVDAIPVYEEVLAYISS